VVAIRGPLSGVEELPGERARVAVRVPAELRAGALERGDVASGVLGEARPGLVAVAVVMCREPLGDEPAVQLRHGRVRPAEDERPRAGERWGLLAAARLLGDAELLAGEDPVWLPDAVGLRQVPPVHVQAPGDDGQVVPRLDPVDV